MDIVIVDWEDAKSIGGWTASSDVEHLHTAEAHSVGYLIRADDKEVVLAGTVAPEDNFLHETMLNLLTIPRPWVTSIRRVSPKAKLLPLRRTK